MDGIYALFNSRSVVGARLEGLLTERGYTKSGFCKECKISRPTLDKILNGMIGSEVHFEKHMRKIMDCLAITPDVLLGNATQTRSRTRQIRSLLHIKKEDIAAAIDISVSRLEEIEAGAVMTNAELRDLAVYMGTSTHCVLAQNVFYPQTTMLSDFIDEMDGGEAELSGFWGHLGIMPANSAEYMWYPITRYEAGELHNALNGERAVVPCMDNKLLYLNLEKIKSVVLLDEACDALGYYNWDPSVGEGEIPLVVYEVVEGYLVDRVYGDGGDEDGFEGGGCGSADSSDSEVDGCGAGAVESEMDGCGADAVGEGCDSAGNSKISDTEYSPKLRKYLDLLIKEKGWTEDDVHKMASGIRIHYADGSVQENDIDLGYGAGFGSGDWPDLIDAVGDLYMMGEVAKIDKYLSFTDWNGAVTFVNTDEVAVIEMPLVGVEKVIGERM